ncbi:bifunctional hydroxymethylpyrimidine kinase/phosphomethylpyrimidine kinase [Brevibacterium sp. ZH18]|uniref:bifunctional hydroxymethylpyrimidine kinase/phosphomethylpyrimidine kinase n=1 Tax=Brevibacterium sp. ZH18 TaxID=2927784 RepID=UPI001F623000|nr:bifunctional hydroxymethylpyrimidine kinase/phosphomethylpyrimidine kinase [Brevibacterium sp. ZH18]MCI4011140.1 bifunctional hydroxymethylpyrimidine kinase/phosphomethylpyrimidine kinase [Brevibacterium sp. ZH18]
MTGAEQTTRPPIVLSIAGTDPSGGAGIHADLKTFTARGVLGTTAITALVAQNTHGVSRVYPIDDDFVSDQLDSVLTDMPVDATKSGMLGSRSLVELVVERAAQGQLGFYTVDPVMVATSGHRLLEVDAVDAVRDHLLPVSDLITPNLPEAALLLGDDVPAAQNQKQMVEQAKELVARGPRAVLLKGGHALDGDVADVLVTADGELTEFTHPRVPTPNTHGTGCTLSAAITAEVAVRKRERGVTEVSTSLLVDAVDSALNYLARALRSAADWQVSLDPDGAHGPVDHQVDIVRR